MIALRAFKTCQFALAALMVPALAMAASPAAAPAVQSAIAHRQTGYKNMGAAMKALSGELKSAAPARDVMVRSAQTIAAVAREQGQLFPAGSGASSGFRTDALPNIWTDRATFDGLIGRLVTESGKLAAVASGGDAAAIGAQFKATGATCAACHRQFRADT